MTAAPDTDRTGSAEPGRGPRPGRPVPARQRRVAGHRRDPRRPVDGRRVLPAAGRRRGGQPGDRRGGGRAGGARRRGAGQPGAADRRSVPQLHGHRRRWSGVGLAPIAEQLAALDESPTPRACSRCSAGCAGRASAGRSCIDVDSDPADPDRYVLNIYQGGLGLPDESYYSSEQHARDPRGLHRAPAADARAGRRGRRAGRGAGRASTLETELAAGHWDRVRSRDSSQTYNPKDRAGLDELLPAALWDAWLAGLGADPAAAGAGGRPAAGLPDRPGRPADRGPDCRPGRTG